MLEIALGIAVCVMMGKLAEAEDRSQLLWFFITLLICIGSLAIPVPFLRMLVGGAVAFGLLMGAKILGDR